MAKVVLIADDYKDIRRMMRVLLEAHGFTVVEATNGVEAVDKAVDERPDIILMDLAMPLMSGIEAARTIRKHEELSRVPIIAITAFGEEFRSEAIEAGFDEIMQKPVDLNRLKPLLDELDVVASRYRQRDQPQD